MKTPEQYNKWLKKIKKEIDYTITDEQSFDIEQANYFMMYNIYQSIKNGGGGYRDCLLYNTLLNKHLKFLNSYGLTGETKLKNKYLKKKVDSTCTPIEKKDALDNFLFE